MEAKRVDIEPLVRQLDTRSPAGLLKMGDWRYALNFHVNAENRLCRVPGWDKLLTSDNYNNADLHDQLLSLTGKAARKPLTFLFQAFSLRKSTMLLAGTGEVIYALNTGTGNWKILSDQIGRDTSRWKAAQVLDTVFFSNGEDPVVYWEFDQGVTESDDQSVAQVPDLRDELKITKSKVIVSWKDHLFLMNVVMDGSVRSNYVMWSNFQKPLDMLPADTSTAGSVELDSGETILAALPLENRLIIYTDKNIWEAVPSGGNQVFAFTKRYAPQQSEACLFYPRTLISIGNQHVYCGVDGIYYYNLFQNKPQRIDWIHKASGIMFANINRSNCEAHVAGYNEERKELMFSYAKTGQSLPSETLVLHTEQNWAYYLDRGFPAMVNYVYKEPGQILRDFLLNQCICTVDGFNETWGGFVKEGGFCTEPDEPECPEPPASIYTVNPKTIDEDEEIETEDYDQAEPDEDSLCAQLDGITLNQLCEAELRVDECRSGLRFVVSDSVDYCLKELSNSYYREECVGFTGCGSYSRKGYVSTLRTGPLGLGVREHEKQIDAIDLEAYPEFQTNPSKFQLKVASSGTALDPNNPGCGLRWATQEFKDVACVSDYTAAQLAEQNIYPDGGYTWPVYEVGRFLYLELSIINDTATPRDTGGACCLARISADIRLRKRAYL